MTLIQFLWFSLYFVAGVVGWTLSEYFIHRLLGHNNKLKNPFTVEHLKHHRETSYFAPTYKKLLAALLVLLIMTPLSALLLGWMSGFFFSFGFASMYATYEFLHRRAHTHGPSNFYGRWLRKHHFYHHFKAPRLNHGVTSPIWDIVFGTFKMPGIVMVPRKLALEWMLDPETKEIFPQYLKDYQLRGGKTAKIG